MTETKILYQNGDYFVMAETFGRSPGFAVYRNTTTHAERCASIGFAGTEGLRRAIREADRRAELKA